MKPDFWDLFFMGLDRLSQIFNKWHGSGYSEVYRQKFDEIALQLPPDGLSAKASFNLKTNHVEFRTSRGFLFAEARVQEEFNHPFSVLVISYGLTPQQKEIFEKALPVPVGFVYGLTPMRKVA